MMMMNGTKRQTRALLLGKNSVTYCCPQFLTDPLDQLRNVLSFFYLLNFSFVSFFWSQGRVKYLRETEGWAETSNLLILEC